MGTSIIMITFFLILIAFVGVGIWAGKRVTGTLDYYVMNRAADARLIIGTTVASVMSAVTYFGALAAWYQRGPFVSSQYGAWLGTWTGLTFGMLYVCRRFRANMALTVPDFIGDRYNSNLVRGLSALVLITALFGYTIAQFQGSGVMLAALTGMSYELFVVITGAILFIFCVLGGQVGVIYTDTAMAICILIMNFLLLPRVIFDAGGFRALTDIPSPKYWSFGGLPGEPWHLAIGTFTIWVFYAMLSPFFSARGFAAKSDLTLLKSGMWSSFLYIAIPFILIIGVAPAMHILDPDVTPAAAVIIETLLPRFHPLLVGFVSGALMGAVISTTSSVLIYMGFAISRDLYQRIINPNIDEAKALLIARIAMALVIIITSFFAIRPPDGLWWIVTYANGILVSGWAPAILLGFEWKNATKEGAIVSLVGGPLAYIIAMLKATTFPPILIGLIVGGLGHVIVSNLTLKKDDKALEVFNRVKNEPLAKHDLQKYMASEEGRQFLLKEYKSVRISSRIVLGIAIAYFSFLYFTIGINIPK